MRLLELEIERVRGIQHLLLKPRGRNFVIWGPNGSGKSAVVDAIDFLLTGRILRLTGSGTGNMSLGKHGPHIDHKPKESTVRALLQLPGFPSTIELKRSMGNPRDLHCSVARDAKLDRTLALAKQGAHILTRREILKYITSDAGTRAQEIQELLDIAEVEEIRKSLVKVKNTQLKNLENTQQAVKRARSRIMATAQLNEFDERQLLDFVNQNRSLLGASGVSQLCSDEIKKEVSAPKVVAQTEGVNLTLFTRDIQNLRGVTSSESKSQIAEANEILCKLTATIRADPELLRSLNSIRLIRLGVGMIDETGKCPLCDKPWAPAELRAYLNKRIETAKVADKYQVQIEKGAGVLLTSVNKTIESLRRVIAGANVARLKDDLTTFKSWLGDLEKFSKRLESPIEKYSDTGWTASEISSMLAPANALQLLTTLDKTIREKCPESTPEQTAWDTLTRIKENLESLEGAEADASNAQLGTKRAALLYDRFVQARDKVLGELYDHVKNRFVSMYRELHGDDEQDFSAAIKPDAAGLDLAVNFHGRGAHPPHALHSEGHQDSMGLCLFLTLAEHLTKGLIDLTVLDDVVMSVDSGHRRGICRLLAKHFPGRQFLITTHDRTWANQLKAEGVVASKGTIEFYNWSLELGPQVNDEVDLWRRIKADLKKNEIPSAAQKLRRGSEQFFGLVCDALQAPVRYRLDGRWELGDLLPAAMSRYRSLLKKAKAAAQGWPNQSCFNELKELDSTAGQIFARCGAEQWAVNASVHYSNWASLSKQDFSPVVEAFEDLCRLFTCSKCGAILHVVAKGVSLTNVRCNCEAVSWNLVGPGRN